MQYNRQLYCQECTSHGQNNFMHDINVITEIGIWKLFEQWAKCWQSLYKSDIDAQYEDHGTLLHQIVKYGHYTIMLVNMAKYETIADEYWKAF